jgi:glutathione S-transferase
MTASPRTLKLYDLATSANNIKVRLALGYKGLPYEKIPVNPTDRTELVEVSGQPLSPVLVHGDTVVFDSSAILRYLDANFRSTPPLFSPRRETMKTIEEWELWCRTDLAKGIGICYGEFRKEGAPDPERLRQASRLFGEAVRRIETTLADRPFLLGPDVTAADLTAAPAVHYGMLPDDPGASPLQRRFREVLRLEDAPRTAAWCRRLMSFDRMPA